MIGEASRICGSHNCAIVGRGDDLAVVGQDCFENRRRRQFFCRLKVGVVGGGSSALSPIEEDSVVGKLAGESKQVGDTRGERLRLVGRGGNRQMVRKNGKRIDENLVGTPRKCGLERRTVGSAKEARATGDSGGIDLGGSRADASGVEHQRGGAQIANLDEREGIIVTLGVGPKTEAREELFNGDVVHDHFLAFMAIRASISSLRSLSL